MSCISGTIPGSFTKKIFSIRLAAVERADKKKMKIERSMINLFSLALKSSLISVLSSYLYLFLRHLKLELLTQTPASNDAKYVCVFVLL